MTFTPRTVVNGSLLRSHLNRDVTILVNIETADSSRRNLRARSTDNVELTIRTEDPIAAKGWVEVIGVPATATEIKANEIILFESNADDEPFDAESHNMLVTFMSSGANVFRSG